MLIKKSWLLSVAIFTLAAAGQVAAAQVINTGDPAGGYMTGFGDYPYFGQVSFTKDSSISSIYTYLAGGTSGETFTLALLDNSSSNLPGNQLYSTTATYGAEGWNGVSGLSDWNVNAANYWVSIGVAPGDTFGRSKGSRYGSGLMTGVPLPLLSAVSKDSTGYHAYNYGFGLQVTTVPLPQSFSLLLGALGLIGIMARAKKI